MSMKPFRWAKKQTGLTSAEKFILIMLADRYNDDWYRAWPSLKSLASDTSLSLSTVQRALRGLQEKGFVSVEQWVLNEGAQWMSNRYLLPLYNPNVRPAFEQPVLAFVASDIDFNYDGMTQVPGSNIYIEDLSLDSDPPESREQFTRNLEAS